MKWSQSMRRGAAAVVLGTLLMIVFTLAFLWMNAAEGVTLLGFLQVSVVIFAVWVAIGATMGIFIVMILRKNEGRN